LSAAIFNQIKYKNVNLLEYICNNQNLNTGPVKYLLACILAFTTLSLSAQLNPRDIYVNAKANEVSTINVQSLLSPNFTIYPQSGYDTLYIHPGSSGFEVKYDPTSGFIGDETIVIEYYEPGPIPGIPFPNYTRLHFRIKSSKVDVGTDYALSSQDSLTIDVLSNDSSTDGSLTIEKLGHVSGGTATINSDNTLNFSFDAGANEGYIRYFASDSLDNVEGGVAHLVKQDDSQIDTKNIFVDNKSELTLQLPSADYEIEGNATNGSLSHLNGHVWLYKPSNSFTGQDTFSFSTTQGGLVSYNVEVLNKDASSSFVIDDEYHAPTNQAITFNVFENDLRTDQSIIDYSSDLTYNGNGEFSYNPPQDFTGDKSFYYKIFTGIAYHTGDIVVHVDDFAPRDELEYSFKILKNHDLKVMHHSPVSAYTFESVVDPSHGTLTILDNNGSEVLDCDVITGNNTIIYVPNPDFNGLDEFDIEYCTNSGVCEIVKIDVKIVDANYTDCLCLNGCVFEGDSNDDGVVDMKDILDLGLNIGEGGFERTNDFDLLWTGQESTDWGHAQMGGGIDLKCGDTDGDGYIDSDDFTSILDNYGNLHNLTSDDLNVATNVPITFDLPANPVDSGEWISLDIRIGNGNLPALDFYGTAFTFNFDPEIIDSSSVIFTLYDDNWLEYGSPLQSMYTVPQDGQVDIGVSRISNASTDGFGVIGKLEFIVEDDIAGFKRSSISNNGSLVSMSQIISTNEKGEYISHPNFEDELIFNSEDENLEEEINSSLSVSPNPTTGLFTIESDKYSIDEVNVIDALGRVLFTDSQAYSKAYNLDITSFNQGVYFVKVTSNGHTFIKKVQKINL